MITVFGEGRGFRVMSTGAATLGDAERAYIARTTAREAYMRAMETCQAAKAWAAQARGH